MIGRNGKLPQLSGQEVCKALQKDGFKYEGTKGSHVKLKKRLEDKVLVVTVPMHSRDLITKTLNSILKQAELSKSEFIKLLK